MTARSPTATSRATSHYRERNLDHPVARYCKEAIGRIDGGAAAVARALRVTPSLVSQWLSGQTHPRAERLIALSVASNVSLGRLSTLASATGDKAPPLLGELEGRIAVIPEVLRGPIFAAIESAEATIRKLPPHTFEASKVHNQRLRDLGWRAESPDTRGAPPDSDVDESKPPKKR